MIKPEHLQKTVPDGYYMKQLDRVVLEEPDYSLKYGYDSMEGARQAIVADAVNNDCTDFCILPVVNSIDYNGEGKYIIEDSNINQDGDINMSGSINVNYITTDSGSNLIINTPKFSINQDGDINMSGSINVNFITTKFSINQDGDINMSGYITIDSGSYITIDSGSIGK
jgi:hypothetical protein